MGTILSELDLESPLVGTVVTAHITAAAPDGFRCTVYDVATAQPREATLPRTEAYAVAPGSRPPALNPGDTIITYVTSVNIVDGEEHLLLSATVPHLVERLLAAVVDEILTGQVAIMGTTRVAGTKTKIAVAPTAAGVDAKGACIGKSGSRIRTVERLLNHHSGHERLEIIEYSSDQARYLVNAMNPVRVTEVLVDGGNAVVALERHQMSGGIGEGGLNAQLAGRLTGLYVRIVGAGTDLRAALDELAAERAAAGQA